MAHATRIGWWLIGLAVAAGLIVLLVFAARPADPQKLAQRMQTQIARIRGLPFKRSVVVHEQSQAEFQKHAFALLERLSSPEQEQVLRTLGLLASDETLNMAAGREQLPAPGVAGRYDPYSGRMFLVKLAYHQHGEAMDDLLAGELYRALLDQHFDLKTYLARRQRGGALNSDELIARQAVVEGEAIFVTVLWHVKQKLGRIPKYLPLEGLANRSVDAQNAIDLLDDPRMREATGTLRSADSKPIYLSQLLGVVQRNGLLFAHAVHRGGWGEVEKLYTSSPPVSTEQILHPEKWFAREQPVAIQWPAFETNEAFAEWELLEQDVLGELLWRVVFRAHRLSPLMDSAPDGWNGDRYAVLKRRGSGDMLLLMYTAWDTEAHAASFAETYRVLVKEKYADKPQQVRIVEDGRRVVIVEGGEESSLDAFMKFAQSAQEIQATVAVEK